MGLNGIDVSAHQPAGIVASVDADFYIVKTSEGVTWKSPAWRRQADDALAKGKLLGLYHFDAGNVGWQQECDHFLNVAHSHIGKALLVWDWEAKAVKQGPDRLRKILTYLKNQLGFPPLLYSSGSPLKTTGAASLATELDCGIWCANYPLDKLGQPPTPVAGFRQDLHPAIPSAVIFQYTQSGRLPGYAPSPGFSGFLDLNVFFGDAAAWRRYATGSGGVTPPTPPAPAITAPGRTEATYQVRPGDTLTGIAARFGTTWQVLARLNNMAVASKILFGQKVRVR